MKTSLAGLLKSNKSGRCNALREAFRNGRHQDPELTPILVDCLADRSTELADFAADVVLPSIGQPAVPLIVQTLNPIGAVADFRRLRVLRQIDPSVARVQGRRCLLGKHTNLVREAISSLTGSAEDGEILLQQTKRRSDDHRFAAYSALCGITIDVVVDAVSEDFKAGKEYVEQAMAYTPHPIYGALCVEALANQIGPMSSRGPLPEETCDRLEAALCASRGQEVEDLDSQLLDYLELAANGGFHRPETQMKSISLIQYLLESIAVNPTLRAQRRLIELRDSFPPSHLIYPMCAASWHADAPIFELFSPYLVGQNSTCRCRGWHCTWRGPWPCSILSAVESALCENFDALDHSGSKPIPKQMRLVERIRADSRWAAAVHAAASK